MILSEWDFLVGKVSPGGSEIPHCDSTVAESVNGSWNKSSNAQISLTLKVHGFLDSEKAIKYLRALHAHMISPSGRTGIRSFFIVEFQNNLCFQLRYYRPISVKGPLFVLNTLLKI